MALNRNRPSKTTKEKTQKEKILSDVTDSTEKKKRLNTDIEESLYKKIKIKSVEEGRSISEITRELWIEYLSK